MALYFYVRSPLPPARQRAFVAGWVIVLLIGTPCWAGTVEPLSSASRPPTTLPTTRPGGAAYLLHLPGIAGNRSIDHAVMRGLAEGGFPGALEVYDWTEHDPGLDALLARDRNTREARHVAEILAAQVAAHPGQIIDLLCHSGGGGIAVWALEDLPPGVQIHDVVMMAPALSPGYDLSTALRHVVGHCYVFSSLDDVLVLSAGTRWFGTIDGVHADAAGRVGFTPPPTADRQQYQKLEDFPYDPSWTQFGDFGDHRSGMTRTFGKLVLDPLLLAGVAPPVSLPFVVTTPTGLGRAATEPAKP